MVQTIKRTKSPQQALNALMRMCSRAERCSADALRLMKRWEISSADASQILQRLIKERFIDDARYAEAFVREKINLSGWGAYKITAALRAKGIDRDTIAQALGQMSEVDISARLVELLQRKSRTVKAKNSADLRAKLLRYAAGLGYDFSTAKSCVERVVKDDEQCEYFDL